MVNITMFQFTPCDHDAPKIARGLCRKCYDKARYADNREKVINRTISRRKRIAATRREIKKRELVDWNPDWSAETKVRLCAILAYSRGYFKFYADGKPYISVTVRGEDHRPIRALHNELGIGTTRSHVRRNKRTGERYFAGWTWFTRSKAQCLYIAKLALPGLFENKRKAAQFMIEKIEQDIQNNKQKSE